MSGNRSRLGAAWALAVVASFMLGARGLVAAQTPQSISSIVLENFSSLRMNYDSPPTPLFQPWEGGSSNPEYRGQTSSISNGTYVLVAPSKPYLQFMPYPYVDPHGFARQNILSGTWNPKVNRFRFWIKTTQNIPRRSDGGNIAEIGTYTKADDDNPSNQGDHYYHYIDPNFIANQWMLITLNRVPQHLVSSSAIVPENPTAAGGWNYYDGLTRFYFSDEYGDPAVWAGTYTFADFGFDIVNGEPDTLVASVTAVYTGNHYELSWEGPRGMVQRYTVRYSTVSMHQNGLSAGRVAGNTPQTSGSDYAAVLWTSPAMAQPANGLYFAIQPTGQTAFTEIYLPVGPYQGAASSSGGGAPLAPINLHPIRMASASDDRRREGSRNRAGASEAAGSRSFRCCTRSRDVAGSTW